MLEQNKSLKQNIGEKSFFLCLKLIKEEAKKKQIQKEMGKRR